MTLPSRRSLATGLPSTLLRSGQVEHIVHDLKCHSQIASVLSQAFFLLGSGAAQNCAHPHADRKQAGGLAEDQIEVLVERNELAQLFHLQQFAFDHLLGQFDQSVENAEVALLHRDLEGLHVEPVAGQHALGVAPLRVGRGAAAPGLGLVDDVVVHQRRGVNDLDHRAQADGAAPLVVEQFRRKQQQRGTDALAAATAQIFANLGDGFDARDRVPPELALNGGQVFAQKLEEFFSVDGGGSMLI